MIHNELDLTLVRRFKSAAQKALPGRIARVVLFGSRARREAGRHSDWDVAVFLKDQASSRDTFALADAAYDLIVETGDTIHPIALSEVGGDSNPLLLEQIASDGIPV